MVDDEYSLGILLFSFERPVYGGVAQLGARLNGIQEVRGSIPLVSTIFKKSLENTAFLRLHFFVAP